MANGIRIRNQNNIVQIDHNYANLALYASGVAVSSGDDGFGWYTALFDVYGASFGTIAIQCAAPFYLLGQVQISGGIRYRVVTKGAIAFRWFSFATPIGDPGGIGLRIKQENGQVNFNSGLKYMRLLDVRGGDYLELYGNISGGFGGKALAIVQGVLPIDSRFDIFSDFEGFFAVDAGVFQVTANPGGSWSYRYYWDTLKIDGPYDPGSVQHSNTLQPRYSFMVIDVTGF